MCAIGATMVHFVQIADSLRRKKRVILSEVEGSQPFSQQGGDSSGHLGMTGKRAETVLSVLDVRDARKAR